MAVKRLKTKRSYYLPERIDIGGLGEGQVKRRVRTQRAHYLRRQVAEPTRWDAQAVPSRTDNAQVIVLHSSINNTIDAGSTSQKQKN
jgi:hypothetical protein